MRPDYKRKVIDLTTFIMKKIFILFLSLFFCFHHLDAAKSADLTPKDVALTLKEIMQAHVSHKNLNETLVKRALQKYIDELDPIKTYFLKEDLAGWLNPSDTLIQQILADYQIQQFPEFYKIYDSMVKAIERRKKFEMAINSDALPKEVSLKDFKDTEWCENEKDLKERLLKIKALQLSTAEKLTDEDSKEKILQRVLKRRISREEEIICSDHKERDAFILTSVLKAIANSLDTHTAYFTPHEASQFLIQVQQRLFGIGAQLRDDLNGFTIVKIIEGGPAFQSKKLKEKDRVIAINDEPVIGLDIADAVEMIRGEAGTPVRLTLLRLSDEDKEEKVEVEITRGEVVLTESRFEKHLYPYGDGVIARLCLYAFYQDPLHSSAKDLADEINKIKSEYNLKGVILDLRHNSGGVLPQAVAVTGLFITKGIVVSIKDNHGNLEHLREIDGKMAWDGPLIVLTSRLSASAAEIVAQTLQDYGRAIIVGDDHSFGKGSFQTFTLDAVGGHQKINSKGEFKVTRGRYYTVSGKSPQLIGVESDIVVPGAFSKLEIGERFAEYPLENDKITENFHDDLSDIPASQRDQVSWLYRFNLQQKIKTYNPYISLLKENSNQRIKENKLYQSFLKELDKDDISESTVEFFNQTDLQLDEAVNVMKDLIVVLER